MNKAARKNGLMGANGRMSRHMETTAKEYLVRGCFRQSGEAIPENGKRGRRCSGMRGLVDFACSRRLGYQGDFE